MPPEPRKKGDLCGFINLLKPPGITSFTAVSEVRRLLGARAGHAGTLDPAAAGVLVICVGAATRLASYAADSPKTYRAEVTFGIATDTLDAEGQVTQQSDASGLDERALRLAIEKFVGEIEQIPPVFSAVQVGGKRLYALARKGKPVAPPPRKVMVHSIQLLSFRAGARASALLDINCGKGTYVRSLCADIGRSLGLPAYVSFLLRTRVGNFCISDSSTLEELREAAARSELSEALLPPDAPLMDLPAAVLEAPQVALLTAGAPVNWRGPQAGAVRVYDGQGKFIAVAKAMGAGVLRPTLILAPREQT